MPTSTRVSQAQRTRLQTVLDAQPVCFNHNLETVQRLQGEVRRGATYERSLGLLAAARELAPMIPTKSGLMLGLGETADEVVEAMHDLRAAGWGTAHARPIPPSVARPSARAALLASR